MKRDEVREVLGRGVEYVRVHERTTLYVVGGLIGVLLIAAVVIFFLGRRESSASERLADALRIYGAKVDPLDPAPDDAGEAALRHRPGAPRPVEGGVREARLERSTDAGQVANVYLGEIAARSGDTETARRLWTEYLSANPGTALAMSVELNLLALDRQAGKLEEVKSGLEKQLEEGAKRTPARGRGPLRARAPRSRRSGRDDRGAGHAAAPGRRSPALAVRVRSPPTPARADELIARRMASPATRSGAGSIPHPRAQARRSGAAQEEIRAVVTGSLRNWSDGQVGAFLMAAAIRGLDAAETRVLTEAMAGRASCGTSAP